MFADAIEEGTVICRPCVSWGRLREELERSISCAPMVGRRINE